jgi:hypothetical protein
MRSGPARGILLSTKAHTHTRLRIRSKHTSTEKTNVQIKILGNPHSTWDLKKACPQNPSPRNLSLTLMRAFPSWFWPVPSGPAPQNGSLASS